MFSSWNCAVLLYLLEKKFSYETATKQHWTRRYGNWQRAYGRPRARVRVRRSDDEVIDLLRVRVSLSNNNLNSPLLLSRAGCLAR